MLVITVITVIMMFWNDGIETYSEGDLLNKLRSIRIQVGPPHP